ncbi:hypothetical protein [Neptunomonas japonica]|uniref:hypothetical protein n=1 Tax=Neptunomonas japonica TaxID=417574 RepID=UPI000406D178|nr:hypothetical protein [Neptunomonas japonica]
MIQSGMSYPHPVLGNGDDISSGEELILPTITCNIFDEAISLQITELEAKHEQIDALIKSGDAAWLIRVNCPRTYYREAFISTDVHWEHKFDGPDFIGKVVIEISVVALKPVEGYAPEGMHSDYEGATFNINSGELIAIAPSYSFLAEKDFDALKAPVASLVKIVEGENDIGPFECSYDDDLIIVTLSKIDWSEYAAIRDRVSTTLHTSIVLPVLVGALYYLEEHGTGSTWTDRLEEIVNRLDLSLDNPLMSAQEILSNPLQRAFTEVNKELDKRSS